MISRWTALMVLLLAPETQAQIVSSFPGPVTVNFEVIYGDPALAAQEIEVKMWRRVNKNAPVLIKLPAKSRAYEDKNITQGVNDRTYCYQAQVSTKKGDSALGQPELCLTVKAPPVLKLSTTVISYGTKGGP